MEYIVPIITAITAFLGGIAAMRRVWNSGQDSAIKALERIADRLEKRVKDLEMDRDANEQEIDAQQRRIRDLEDRERAREEKLVAMERDHGALIRAHNRLKAEHAELKDSFSRLARRVDYYRNGVVVLIKYIRDQGLIPPWEPGEEEV